ncbi:MAG: Glycogen synthase [candidate division WWE3 bacterium GW2011_GWB1_42_117]|nr:MAG: Glycogen synthase [candidate division WWE3 bacterium GW2011_GWB1_42_117]
MADKKSPKVHKILLVATEAQPYVSVGGAGSVIGHLSGALTGLGYEVAVFIPKFGLIDEQKYPMKMAMEGLAVPTDDAINPELVCNVKYYENGSGVKIFFLENQEYFEKRANVYGYSDDPTRFLLLSRGALEFVRRGGFVPDVIHCNDWHAASIPFYIKTLYKNDPVLKNISSLLTIHNLAYQGIFDHRHVSEMNFDDGKSVIGSIFSDRVNTLNYMRRGIIFADAVNTVSRTYSKEILTPEFGEGLDKLLSELKGKLFGIVNGIDYDEFDPATDKLLHKNFDVNNIELRSENKKALQKEFDLPVSSEKMVFAFVGRLDFMKGVDLLTTVMHHVLKEYDVQFVEVGAGDWSLTERLNNLKNEFPTQVGIHPYPNFTLPRLVFGGADCILYPSRFEPCGIVQIEAMRYGAIPIVRNVGGLADTVENFDTIKQTGTGFLFNEFDEFSLFGKIIRAAELYKNAKLWRSLQTNAMRADYSWEFSAREYSKLYETTKNFHEGINGCDPRGTLKFLMLWAGV